MPYVPSEKTDPPAEDRKILDPIAKEAAEAIAAVAKKYNYTGAFLGELNFFITRLLNHLPRALVKTGESQSELKYVLQAGMFGVLIDVLLEYKIRVNPAYEIAQIIKSGDCYDTPYYNKPVEVVDESGKIVGHVYVNMKRSDKTVGQDVLEGVQMVLRDVEVIPGSRYKCNDCYNEFEAEDRRCVKYSFSKEYSCPHCHSYAIEKL